MREIITKFSLESFRDPKFPVYWILDTDIAGKLATLFQGRDYGLEIGFGMQPSRCYLVDQTRPWLITEPDLDDFLKAENSLAEYWHDVSPNLPPDFTMFSLAIAADEAMISHARVILYRNLDYRNMYIPSYEKLRPGQRLVFIVDEARVNEIEKYKKFLRQHPVYLAHFSERAIHKRQHLACPTPAIRWPMFLM